MRIAAAGPLVSLILAIGTGLVGGVLMFAGAPLVGEMTLWALAVPNLVLFLFNLIPAFPMDGGRLLRAAITESRGRLEATRMAARIGRGLAVVLGVVAVVVWRDVRLALLALAVWALAGLEYRMELAKATASGKLFDVDGDGEPDAVIVGPPPYARPHAAGLWREVLAAMRILNSRMFRVGGAA
jgi:stage IV sporulation protein FB